MHTVALTGFSHLAKFMSFVTYTSLWFLKEIPLHRSLFYFKCFRHLATITTGICLRTPSFPVSWLKS